MKLFEDDKGNSSSMRVVWALCVLMVFGVWSYICIQKGELISFQVGDATLIAFLFGGKLGQKYIELKNGGK